MTKHLYALLLVLAVYTAPVRADLVHNVGDAWAKPLFTTIETRSNVPVRFTLAEYARAADTLESHFPAWLMRDFVVSLEELAGASGRSTLALIHTEVWDVRSGTVCPLTVFGECRSVGVSFIPSRVSTTATPILPTFWLLISGVAGLLGVALKAKKSPFFAFSFWVDKIYVVCYSPNGPLPPPGCLGLLRCCCRRSTDEPQGSLLPAMCRNIWTPLWDRRKHSLFCFRFFFTCLAVALAQAGVTLPAAVSQ